MNNNFVHTHCHTHDSNNRMKDSICKTENLIQYAADLGNPGVAITDHESLSAHITAVNYVNKAKKDGKIPQDFKLILGNEIYLVDDEDLTNRLINKQHIDFYHCILLAKDKEGHRQLRELSSRAWKNHYFSYKGMDRVPTYYSDLEDVIGKNPGHIICTSACMGSYLGKMFEQMQETENEDVIYDIKCQMGDYLDFMVELFEKDFYLEMQPNSFENQKLYNQMLVRMSKSYNIPLTIATDVHYYDKSYRLVHKAFLTSDESDANREVDAFYESTHFFTVDELFEAMKDYLDKEIIEESINNTVKIKDSITDDYGLFNKTEIPLTPLPPKEEWYPVNLDIIENYPNIKALYYDEYEHHTYLIHQIFRGINKRKIPFTEMKATLERIDLEASELVGITEHLNNPMGAYLTTFQKTLEIIWKVSVVGCGRGSAVGWIINYLLEITDINPLKQKGMTFRHWRFLSAERPDYWQKFIA